MLLYTTICYYILLYTNITTTNTTTTNTTNTTTTNTNTTYITFTSSTAQGGGGSFKNKKPIGEVGCCESRMAERSA